MVMKASGRRRVGGATKRRLRGHRRTASVTSFRRGGPVRGTTMPRSGSGPSWCGVRRQGEVEPRTRGGAGDGRVPWLLARRAILALAHVPDFRCSAQGCGEAVENSGGAVFPLVRSLRPKLARQRRVTYCSRVLLSSLPQGHLPSAQPEHVRARPRRPLRSPSVACFCRSPWLLSAACPHLASSKAERPRWPSCFSPACATRCSRFEPALPLLHQPKPKTRKDGRRFDPARPCSLLRRPGRRLRVYQAVSGRRGRLDRCPHRDLPPMRRLLYPGPVCTRRRRGALSRLPTPECASPVSLAPRRTAPADWITCVPQAESMVRTRSLNPRGTRFSLLTVRSKAASGSASRFPSRSWRRATSSSTSCVPSALSKALACRD